jgi:hypothetical protein
MNEALEIGKFICNNLQTQPADQNTNQSTLGWCMHTFGSEMNKNNFNANNESKLRKCSPAYIVDDDVGYISPALDLKDHECGLFQVGKGVFRGKSRFICCGKDRRRRRALTLK